MVPFRDVVQKNKSHDLWKLLSFWEWKVVWPVLVTIELSPSCRIWTSLFSRSSRYRWTRPRSRSLNFGWWLCNHPRERRPLDRCKVNRSIRYLRHFTAVSQKLHYGWIGTSITPGSQNVDITLTRYVAWRRAARIRLLPKAFLGYAPSYLWAISGRYWRVFTCCARYKRSRPTSTMQL